MKRLGSRDNALFKALRALSEDPREVRRQRRTLLDGIHLVSVCLERHIPVQQVIVSESAQDHPEIRRLLEMVQSMVTAEVIQLNDVLFAAISGVATPVGIAAVIALPVDEDRDIAGDAVLLDAVQDAGNVGAILRTAAAAGVSNVVLGHGCAGVWTPRVLRAGQGAHFALQIRESVDLVAWLGQRPELAQCSIATVTRDGADIYQSDLTGQNLWLLGNEGAGLSPSLTAMAGRRLTIPLAADTESLNVAAAAAVCLFEAVRQRR